jgi:hypothetical protein
MLYLLANVPVNVLDPVPEPMLIPPFGAYTDPTHF